jgi:phosphatidylglycerol:prolipoprotein diacylglycerol transferase
MMLSVFLARRANRQDDFLESFDFDRTMLMGIIWAFIGARLLFAWTLRDELYGDPLGALRFWEGGLVFYGGPIAAGTYLLWHFVFSPKARSENDAAERWVRFSRFADCAIPATVLGHAFGRIGCFLGGCCFGRPYASESIFAVKYPLGSDAFFADLGQNAPHLYGNVPVPLIEAILLVFLFAWLQRVRAHRAFPGQIVLSYLILYPAIRFVLEIFRGDSVRGFVVELEGLSTWLSDLLGFGDVSERPLFLSTSQFISVLVVVFAFWLSRRLKNQRLESPPSPTV